MVVAIHTSAVECNIQIPTQASTADRGLVQSQVAHALVILQAPSQSQRLSFYLNLAQGHKNEYGVFRAVMGRNLN